MSHHHNTITSMNIWPRVNVMRWPWTLNTSGVSHCYPWVAKPFAASHMDGKVEIQQDLTQYMGFLHLCLQANTLVQQLGDWSITFGPPLVPLSLSSPKTTSTFIITATSGLFPFLPRVPQSAYSLSTAHTYDHQYQCSLCQKYLIYFTCSLCVCHCILLSSI